MNLYLTKFKILYIMIVLEFGDNCQGDETSGLREIWQWCPHIIKKKIHNKWILMIIRKQKTLFFAFNINSSFALESFMHDNKGTNSDDA